MIPLDGSAMWRRVRTDNPLNSVLAGSSLIDLKKY